ncbi:MAG: hypothetical protein JST26_01750 [Bacteroidetes bacterium]|nr:hypothetical protein [Bacteroidota bacterium]
MLFLIPRDVSSQNDTSKITSSYFVGKWAFGYRDTIKKHVFAIKSWQYIFYKDGTYKENRKPFEGTKPRRYARGTWEYKNGKLIMDQNDTKITKSSPQTLDIVIIDHKLFWELGDEGPGVPVYMFYKKRK